MADFVAWLALLVAVGSLWISYLGYRGGVPAISCHTVLFLRHESPGYDARTGASVSIINQSAVAVTVDAIKWPRTPSQIEAELVDGPSLPHRLEGHSTATFYLWHPGIVQALPGVVIAGRVRPALITGQIHLDRPEVPLPERKE